MRVICGSFIMMMGILLTGCQTGRILHLSNLPSEKLDRRETVMIAIPRDGVYGSFHYAGSGTNVAMTLESAFSRHINKAMLGIEGADVPETIENAKQKACGYLILPKITHWEDRATEWSLLRDKMAIIISVYAVTNGVELRKVEIDGKSSWFTLGGDHPQDLLEKPFRQFVDSLYQK